MEKVVKTITEEYWTLSHEGLGDARAAVDCDGDISITQDGDTVYLNPEELIALAEAVKNALNNTQEGE